MRGVVCVQLGEGRVATEEAVAVRAVGAEGGLDYGFRIEAPDSLGSSASPIWRRVMHRRAPPSVHAPPKSCARTVGSRRSDGLRHRAGRDWNWRQSRQLSQRPVENLVLRVRTGTLYKGTGRITSILRSSTSS